MKRPRRKSPSTDTSTPATSPLSKPSTEQGNSRVSADELDGEFQIQIQSAFKNPDDAALPVNADMQAQHIFETVTRLGGEVCRMRSEVDELLEQNSTLLNAFEKLWEMLDEKGTMNMDDFDLACEVLDSPMKNLKPQAIKKSYN